MYCIECGEELKSDVKFCGKCGAKIESSSVQGKQQLPKDNGVQSMPKKVYAEEKKPILALFLSLLIIGVGQFYNGDIKKGLLMLTVGIITGIFSAGILWIFISIWSAYDAYNVAIMKTPLWV